MAIVYKLVSNQNENNQLVYIGSTKQGLNIRLSKHKHDYKRYLNGKYHYVTSFKLFELHGIDNVNIEIIENIDNDNILELHNREKHYINTIECVNKIYKNN